MEFFHLEKLHKSLFFIKLGKASAEYARGNYVNKEVQPETEPIVIPNRSRIYVEMETDEVFTGRLQNIYKSVVPIWVLRPYQPHHPSNLIEHVYVLMPNGEGLTASIQPLPHTTNKKKMNTENTCFIRIKRSAVLISFLEPYNHDPAELYSNPIVYLRLPEKNNTVYSGELKYGDGYLPSWFSWEE